MALKPTDAELAILRILWSHGASTVREVHDAMASSRAYTTTLKTLQVMTEKGLALREEHRGLHLYRAAHGEEETLETLVTDLLDRAFGGSTSRLVMQALNARRASADDLREIKRVLSARTAATEKGPRDG